MHKLSATEWLTRDSSNHFSLRAHIWKMSAKLQYHADSHEFRFKWRESIWNSAKLQHELHNKQFNCLSDKTDTWPHSVENHRIIVNIFAFKR